MINQANSFKAILISSGFKQEINRNTEEYKKDNITARIINIKDKASVCLDIPITQNSRLGSFSVKFSSLESLESFIDDI